MVNTFKLGLENVTLVEFVQRLIVIKIIFVARINFSKRLHKNKINLENVTLVEFVQRLN